jgi:hypothetical protein
MADDKDAKFEGILAVLQRLPNWPRGMPLDLAAAYCGISGGLLRAIGPQPVRIGQKRKVWLREDLDAWLDRMAGKEASSSTNPWLEE